MENPRKQRLLTYTEYKLREAYDENGEWYEEDDGSFEEPKPIPEQMAQGNWYAPFQPGDDVLVNPNKDANWDAMETVPGNLPSLKDDDVPTGYSMKRRPSKNPVVPGPTDTVAEDLQTLGMDERPRFAEMPDDAMKTAGADKPEPDEDPEDWQAKKDITEIADVYGLKLGTTKTGKLVVQGNRSQWRQDFPDYVSAKKWIESNMDKIMKR